MVRLPCALAEVVSSLNLEEKHQLQEIIEQQIFEAEEALYSDDAQTQAEIQAVRRWRTFCFAYVIKLRIT